MDPTPATVAVAESIRDHLLSPPKALQVLGTQTPTTIEPALSVSGALKLMHDHDYSQLPVYEGSSYVGLLTNNAIGRWVADQMHMHHGLAEDAPVSDVLPFAEESDRVVHVPRDITAADAVAKFADSAEKGAPVTALIVTEAGKPTETPLLIIVSADVPRLTA